MVDAEQYITNMPGDEDDDIVKKFQAISQQLEAANNELQQKNKTILEQKHTIEDLNKISLGLQYL